MKTQIRGMMCKKNMKLTFHEFLDTMWHPVIMSNVVIFSYHRDADNEINYSMVFNNFFSESKGGILDFF